MTKQMIDAIFKTHSDFQNLKKPRREKSKEGSKTKAVLSAVAKQEEKSSRDVAHAALNNSTAWPVAKR